MGRWGHYRNRERKQAMGAQMVMWCVKLGIVIGTGLSMGVLSSAAAGVLVADLGQKQVLSVVCIAGCASHK